MALKIQDGSCCSSKINCIGFTFAIYSDSCFTNSVTLPTNSFIFFVFRSPTFAESQQNQIPILLQNPTIQQNFSENDLKTAILNITSTIPNPPSKSVTPNRLSKSKKPKKKLRECYKRKQHCCFLFYFLILVSYTLIGGLIFLVSNFY